MRGCLLLQKLQYLIGGVHKLYGCKQCVQRQQYMQQGLYETTSALRDDATDETPTDDEGVKFY